MNIERDKAASFGKFLRSKRLNKGLSLEDVFHMTKIRPNVLQQIEEEALDQFPSELFLKSFLKTYADAIEVDIKEVLSLYENAINVGKETTGHVKSYRPESFNILFWATGICVLTLIFFLSYPFLQKKINDYLKEPVKNNLMEKLEISTSFPPVKVEPKIEKTIKPEIETNLDFGKDNNKKINTLTLDLHAKETTWLKITSDDEAPREFTLNPGDNLSMYATDHFNLLLGNAKGVSIYLNNKLVTIPDKYGQVVSLKLP